jgi:short-subunit dehydrogenase involved in D-alanine esterification of teichoic acids
VWAGIGLATAKLFTSEGANVVITARTEESFETIQKNFGTLFDIVQAGLSVLRHFRSLVNCKPIVRKIYPASERSQDCYPYVFNVLNNTSKIVKLISH